MPCVKETKYHLMKMPKTIVQIDHYATQKRRTKGERKRRAVWLQLMMDYNVSDWEQGSLEIDEMIY
jgi:hypothetical protein